MINHRSLNCRWGSLRTNPLVCFCFLFPSNAWRGAPCTFRSDKGQPKNECQNCSHENNHWVQDSAGASQNGIPEKKIKEGERPASTGCPHLDNFVILRVPPPISLDPQRNWIMDVLYRREQIHSNCATRKDCQRSGDSRELSCDRFPPNNPQNLPL